MAIQMCLSVGMFAVFFPLLAIGEFDQNSLWAMLVKMACVSSFGLMLWAALAGFKRVRDMQDQESRFYKQWVSDIIQREAKMWGWT